MREIKFRAWDTKNKKWLESVPYLEELLDHPDDAVSHHDIDDEAGLFWYPNNCLGPDFDGRVVYQQFIGLKDKNNNKIFEGDICKVFFKKLGEINCIIEWDIMGFGFKMINSEKSSIPCFISEVPVTTEVIGNIFENQNLI